MRPLLGVARLHGDSKDDDKQQQLLVLQELLQPQQGRGCRRLRRLRSGRRASAAVEAARAMAARCAAAPPLPDPNGDAVGAIEVAHSIRHALYHFTLLFCRASRRVINKRFDTSLLPIFTRARFGLWLLYSTLISASGVA